MDNDKEQILSAIRALFIPTGIEINLIWSQDEIKNTGLLDLIPKNATKRHAIEFLMQAEHFSLDNTLFAGDSGNDLAVVESPIKSILVANAGEDVKSEALAISLEACQQESLYLAQGSFLGMNGNYSAGILEGVVHYMPHTLKWLEGPQEKSAR